MFGHIEKIIYIFKTCIKSNFLIYFVLLSNLSFKLQSLIILNVDCASSSYAVMRYGGGLSCHETTLSLPTTMPLHQRDETLFNTRQRTHTFKVFSLTS